MKVLTCNDNYVFVECRSRTCLESNCRPSVFCKNCYGLGFTKISVHHVNAQELPKLAMPDQV